MHSLGLVLVRLFRRLLSLEREADKRKADSLDGTWTSKDLHAVLD